MSSERWVRIKRGPGWIVLGVVVLAVMFVGVVVESSTPTAQDRIESISKRLACPICDGESVFESRNSASANIRTEIAAQVEAGERSDDEIISYFVQRDAKLLLVPSASGFDALVWMLPVFALVCALAGLTFAFRRWRRNATDVPDESDRALVAAALAADDEP